MIDGSPFVRTQVISESIVVNSINFEVQKRVLYLFVNFYVHTVGVGGRLFVSGVLFVTIDQSINL